MMDLATIERAIPECLASVELPGLGAKLQGKVRDYYILDGKRILVTTDRISAFDRVLGLIPFKGQVLNELSAFWFRETEDIVANHMLDVPDPNVMVVRNCRPYPIEIVVRGYITGVTTTSLWYNYQRGERKIYGLRFPEGLRKNQRLPEPIITPTTRGTGPSGHDERITAREIIERGIVPEAAFREICQTAFNLFARGSELCQKAGLILVDTKYEFGEADGQLMLIDEVHTPDSSRFWLAESYEERFAQGLEPENYDKEFLRLWFEERGYRGDGPIPHMPPDFIARVSERYISLYEMMTRQEFQPGRRPIAVRIEANLREGRWIP